LATVAADAVPGAASPAVAAAKAAIAPAPAL
jgi:hypothetical protein